jgi:hypothetical protein
LLRESMDPISPFYEVYTSSGEILYVIEQLGVTRVYRANEVHLIP